MESVLRQASTKAQFEGGFMAAILDLPCDLPMVRMVRRIWCNNRSATGSRLRRRNTNFQLALGDSVQACFR